MAQRHQGDQVGYGGALQDDGNGEARRKIPSV